MKFIYVATVLALNLLFASSVSCQKDQPDNLTTTTYVKVTSKVDGELTAVGITENRDMTKYEDGGFFDCRDWTRAQGSQPCDEHKLRDFIWKKWQEKSRGYVRVTYDSPDAVSTSHIFIEPDKNGDWSVRWRIARWHAMAGGSNQITNVERMFAVEQSTEKSNGQWSVIFKNKAGVTLERIPDL
jgi:hypothetical protein